MIFTVADLWDSFSLGGLGVGMKKALAGPSNENSNLLASVAPCLFGNMGMHL